MSDSSFPEPRQWNGDEPDPGAHEERPEEQYCSACGKLPGPCGCQCDDRYDYDAEIPGARDWSTQPGKDWIEP